MLKIKFYKNFAVMCWGNVVVNFWNSDDRFAVFKTNHVIESKFIENENKFTESENG